MNLNQVSQKQWFLIDGIGAVITSAMLALVLGNFESIFGVPKDVLFILAGIAFIFALYSFTCFFFLKRNRSIFLKIIAFANTLYCIITFVLVFMILEQTTWLGISYFIGEILIVMVLVSFELKASKSE